MKVIRFVIHVFIKSYETNCSYETSNVVLCIDVFCIVPKREKLKIRLHLMKMRSNFLVYHLISGAEEVVSRVARVLLMAEQTVEDEKIAKVRTHVLYVVSCSVCASFYFFCRLRAFGNSSPLN